jgi:hypothetical protein
MPIGPRLWDIRRYKDGSGWHADMDGDDKSHSLAVYLIAFDPSDSPCGPSGSASLADGYIPPEPG